MNERKGAQRGGRPRKKVRGFDFAALRWDTIKHGRESLTGILTAFAVGDVAEGKLRIMTYGARALLAFLEAERGLDLDKRIAVLEERAREMKETKG